MKTKAKTSNVFKLSAVCAGALILAALLFPTKLSRVTHGIRAFLGVNFGALYLLLASVIVGVCLYCILSPFGKIRLGDPDSRPEHNTITWLAMLFSAGMGIGLVFYGAAEPLSHFAVSAPRAELYSAEALADAMQYSFLHYGINAWAIYAIVALALAYFHFRKKERFLISVTLKPLIGSRTDGPIGTVLDSLTIIATIVGVATTLGLGAAQINGGLNFLFGVPETHTSAIVIIFVASVLYIWSAVSGIDKGISTISNINVIIAVILMVTLAAIGPTVRIFNFTTESIGAYLNSFLELSFRTEANNPQGQAWMQQWTIMYWSWWISWSPFVGIFIARISKGRTIREFMTFVLLLPTLFSFLWFGVFGTLSTTAVSANHALARLPAEKMLFGVLEGIPLGKILSVIAIILVFSFFITSADSATVVLAMESENGALKPRTLTKLVWGVFLSLIAVALLLAGGLEALQDVMIIFAFPFALLLIFMMVALLRELHYEQKEMGLYIKPKKHPTRDEPFRSYEEDSSEEA